MTIDTVDDAIDLILASRRKQPVGGLDEHTRQPQHTARLLALAGLPARPFPAAVVTGSKGKGSTVAIAAKLLEHMGLRTGSLTSPHLRRWNERIRVNGVAISDAELVRLTTRLAPCIRTVVDDLPPGGVLSPQGGFLALALAHFAEQGVEAAVLEVGRGGRFDDVALAPHAVAAFTPIFREHAGYLGELDRIAWHKAGIIPAGGRAYSLPQPEVVLAALRAEAQARGAALEVLTGEALGQVVARGAGWTRFTLPGYGELELALMGDYQVQNAALALRIAGDLYAGARQGAVPAPGAVRSGLASVRWPGRLQQLAEAPAVFVEGAVNALSAQALLDSLAGRLTHPLVIIAGVPADRDLAAVYGALGAAADTLILTETHIHPNIHFPPAATALALARAATADAQYRASLPAALALARALATPSGTIVLAVAQPLVGEALLLYDVDLMAI
jgi:dihydrofolate synthase / folylpolyglutamate synthase